MAYAEFSADGQTVATASDDKTAALWDAASGGRIAEMQHGGRVASAVFSEDGERVVTASDDGAARIFDARTGVEAARFVGHKGKVFAAVFNSAGTRVLTVSDDDKTTRVWDATVGRPLAAFVKHGDIVTSVAFSPDGQRIVTASLDKTARIWDAASGKPIATLSGHDGPVWSAAFSPDGRRIVTASADGTARVDATSRAVNCTRTSDSVPDDVAALVEASIADNTRRAYRSDLAHFAAWGGQMPADPALVASYLAAHAETLSVATLVRRIATISKAHEARGLPNPCRSEFVRATLRGIKRTRGVAQRAAKPLLREDLFRVLDTIGEGMKDTRDRALLLIGFAGGFRRSEIVGLDCDDIERVRQGLIVTLIRSKTDQEGAGRKVGIPFGRTRHCPVLALEQWLAVSGIKTGPVFRPVGRHGHIAAQRLSGEAVSVNVKEQVAMANIDPTGYSGHSLRAGFATSAVQAGVSTLKIRSQTGHASEVMLARYVRDGELFLDNAAGALL